MGFLLFVDSPLSLQFVGFLLFLELDRSSPLAILQESLLVRRQLVEGRVPSYLQDFLMLVLEGDFVPLDLVNLQQPRPGCDDMGPENDRFIIIDRRPIIVMPRLEIDIPQ